MCLTAGTARAAELSLVVPSACSLGEDITFRIERALGKPLAAAAPVRCSVRIERRAGAYAAQLEVEPIGEVRRSRVRTITAPTCEQLSETLALAVVLAIGAETEEASADESSVHEASAGEPVSTALASPLPPGVPEADAPTGYLQPPVEGEPGAIFGARVAALADAGTLPGAGLGGEMAVVLGWEAIALHLSGTYLPERRAPLDGPGKAAIGLLAGGLSACRPALARSGALALGVCAGVELGWLQGSGSGLDVDRSGGALWAAGRAGAAAHWQLGSGIGLELALAALVPFERDAFAIGGVGQVHRPSMVVGRASAGLSIELSSRDRNPQ